MKGEMGWTVLLRDVCSLVSYPDRTEYVDRHMLHRMPKSKWSLIAKHVALTCRIGISLLYLIILDR